MVVDRLVDERVRADKQQEEVEEGEDVKNEEVEKQETVELPRPSQSSQKATT